MYLAANYLLDDDLKIICRGMVPVENTLYLAYDPTKVTSDQVKSMKQFCS